MRNLWKHFWHDLANDEKMAKRLVAAVFLAGSTGLVTCTALVGPTWAKIACALGAALCGALVPLVTADTAETKP
jgi:hypothetical protein